jgi:hypothetical protein
MTGFKRTASEVAVPKPPPDEFPAGCHGLELDYSCFCVVEGKRFALFR